MRCRARPNSRLYHPPGVHLYPTVTLYIYRSFTPRHNLPFLNFRCPRFRCPHWNSDIILDSLPIYRTPKYRRNYFCKNVLNDLLSLCLTILFILLRFIIFLHICWIESRPFLLRRLLSYILLRRLSSWNL